MTRTPVRALAAAVLSCMLMGYAGAAVVEADLNTSGDGLLTLDLDNGLAFLDLAESMVEGSNRPFNDVIAQFGPGGDFEGFRHATADEVLALWVSAGIPNIDAGGTTANHDPVDKLIDLLGNTSPSPDLFKFAQGIVSDNDPDVPGSTHQFTLMEVIGAVARVRSDDGDLLDTEVTLNGGHFLVREIGDASTIPAPAALPAGIALLGMIGLNRRRHA